MTLDDVLGKDCKRCGNSLTKVFHDIRSWGFNQPDDAFYEGFCDKLCRKMWEKEQIREGKMESVKSFVVMMDTRHTDSVGQPIWFPKNGKPYYDRALGRTFKSKAEKSAYMKKKGLVMDGSSNPSRWPVEAGDMRYKSKRREYGMED